MSGSPRTVCKRRGRRDLRSESGYDSSGEQFPLTSIQHNANPDALEAGHLTGPSSPDFHSPRRGMREPGYGVANNSELGIPEAESYRQHDAIQHDAQEPLLVSNSTQNESSTSSSSTTVPIQQPAKDIAMDVFPLLHERLWLSAVLVVLPVVCPLAIILAIIFKYRVKVQMSLFPGSQHISPLHVLVDFRDTRLMLIASVLTTINPLLEVYIMALYCPNIARSLWISAKEDRLPSLHEFTLLGGICEASPLQLAAAYYHEYRRRISFTPALRLAASTRFKLIMLGVVTFGANVFLHLTTEMIEFHKFDLESRYEPGRGLSQLCLEGNRQENSYPCTYNLSDPDMPRHLLEQFRLQRNTSSISQIAFVREHVDGSTLALLVPLDVPSTIDYRATSIGVSTECSFITSECSMRYASENISDASTYYTIFNCSTGFYGVLGKAPVINNSLTANDGDIPPLGYKPVARLQLGYYIDPSLENAYNPVGYDPATLYATEKPLPDSELVNPAYLAVAGRISFLGLGVDFKGNEDVFTGEHVYVEFAMRCKLTTFDVEYSRLSGTLEDVSSSPTNGSVLEIFHGVQFYDVSTSSAFDLQEILAQVGLQPTTKDLARKWEILFSAKVLCVIGSVTTSRRPLLQQASTHMLVAKISWLAVAFMGCCTLAYVFVGLRIIVSTRRTNTKEKLLGEVLSTPGAGFAAFQSPKNMMRSMRMSELADGSTLEQGNDRVSVEELPGVFQLKTVAPRGE
jgi:hypothetical protein